MSQVRAKFKCTGIRRSMGNRQDDQGKYVPCETQTLELHPVTGEKGSESRLFWNATPGGKIELSCVNLEAAQKFELGKEYYVDFTPAD